MATVIFTQALSSQLGRHGVADRHGRSALLHLCVPDQHHAHALRVQAATARYPVTSYWSHLNHNRVPGLRRDRVHPWSQ